MAQAAIESPGMSPGPECRTGLPQAPTQLVVNGEPLTGRYAGRIDRIDWSDLSGAHRRSALWRRLHHKRWQYIGIGSEQVFIGVAIVDLGWGVTSFAYVFDRLRKRVLADWAQDGLPWVSGSVSDEPVQGAKALFRGPGAQVSVQHVAGDVIALRVKTPHCRVHADLSLANAAPFLLAVGPIDGGMAHATQKSSALSVSGWAEVGQQRWSLSDAVGCLDASNGLLAHDTSWRWACAHSPQVGFNLQQGYFGEQENALWLDGELIPLGAAQFEFDARNPLTTWRVHTVDGLLDLHFSPEGGRHDDRDLLLVASHYVQPVGTFRGIVKRTLGSDPVPVKDLLGVTEDHRSRW
jgi:hypothetical protein